jgi:hypothetical protein
MASGAASEVDQLLDDIRRWQACQGRILRTPLAGRHIAVAPGIDIGGAPALNDLGHRRVRVRMPVRNGKQAGAIPGASAARSGAVSLAPKPPAELARLVLGLRCSCCITRDIAATKIV